MKSKIVGAGIGLACTLLAAGCSDKSQVQAASDADPNAVVARFSGGEIRRSEIRVAVENRLASAPRPIASETRQVAVRKVVERRVRVAMLEAEARAKGYEARPEVAYRVSAAVDRLLAADLVATSVAGARAADSVVAAAVEQRMQSLRPEEARKFSHIYLRAAATDAAARAAAEAKMQTILGELRGGAGFNELAQRYSDSVDARGGGRIEWTVRKSLQRAAADAIFALREGGLSEVIATADGLHLFRLDGIRSAAPIDAEQVRRSVRTELDKEAQGLAERALRQQELDAAGAEFASIPEKLETVAPERWVARFRGGEIRAAELRTLLASAGAAAVDPASVLRERVENRLLAERRRAQGLSPALEEASAAAQKQGIVDAYRADLIAAIPVEPSDAEVERYYRENGESALFLRDYRLDALFYPQSSESPAAVYAAGERVVAALRAGESFDRLLEASPSPDLQICRDAGRVDFEALGRESIRLRKAILNLAAGEVTAAIYLDGPQATLGAADCRLQGRGVAFVRLREIRPLPLADAGPAIRKALRKEKENAGIEAIQTRLISESKLEILLPEG